MIRKVFLSAILLLFCLQAFTQESVRQQREEYLYWESVLDAYEDFANAREQLRGKRRAAEKLREKQLRIEKLLERPKGKMTEEQQRRFNAISLRSGLPVTIPIAREEEPDVKEPEPANPKPTHPVQSSKKEIPAEETAPEVGIPFQESPVKRLGRDVQVFHPLLPPVASTAAVIPPAPIPVPKLPWRKYLLLQTGFSPQLQLGLMAGASHPSGWGCYASWRMYPSFKRLGETYPAADPEKIWTNGNATIKEQAFHLGVLAGKGPVICYLGGGYGYRNLFWQDAGNAWAQVVPSSVSGVSLETGGILPLGKLCVSLGLGTLAFRTLNVTAGVGICF